MSSITPPLPGATDCGAPCTTEKVQGHFAALYEYLHSRVKIEEEAPSPRDYLESELSAVNKLLDRLPATSVIDRMSLEGRKSYLISTLEELSRIEEDCKAKR